jgi:hypothetical protein
VKCDQSGAGDLRRQQPAVLIRDHPARRAMQI